eukprot:543248_1
MSSSTSSSVNECCEQECCVSLTYARSVETKDAYFCEYMDIITEGPCDIDSIVLPLSSDCKSENDIVTPDDTQTLLYLNPDDPLNPLTGRHAIQFAIIPNQQIAVCTSFDWGDIVDNIDGDEVHIGYTGSSTQFSCYNATVRDLCSVTEMSNVNYDNQLNGAHYEYNTVYLIVMIISSALILMAVANNIFICRKWKQTVDCEIELVDDESHCSDDQSDDTDEEPAYTVVQM